MRVGTRSRSGICALVLLLGLAATAPPAASAAAWHQVPSESPDPSLDVLNGVSSIPGGNSWWAVGRTSTGTLVERGGQAGLTAVPSPSPGVSGSGGGARLEAVSAVSRSSAWAVGTYVRADGQTHTLILHWDGASWRVSPSPDLPGSTPELTGVLALSPTNAWAVGDVFADRESVSKTVAEHWDGRRWRIVPSQNPPGPNGRRGDVLASICRVPGSDALWAVGSHTNLRGGRPLVERWTGTAWKAVDVPTGMLPKHGLGSRLTGVAATRRFVLAVGYFSNSVNGNVFPVALVRTRAGWVVANPVRVPGGMLNALTHPPHERTFWTVGTAFGTSGLQSPFAESWTGRSWRAFHIPGLPASANSSFEGVRATGDGSVLAVGAIDDGGTTVTLAETTG